MREGDSGGHGGDFQGSPLGPAVRPVVLDVGGRDLAPRQPGELGMQAGLVALDGDQVMRAALPGQVLGVGALGVHRVCGDHRPGQVDAVQQRREHRDLVRLRLDIDLAQDHAAGVV